MIDYEFTIQRLEKELAHYRDIQAIQERHLDAHDRGFAAVERILQNVGERLDRLSATLEQTAQQHERDIAALTQNVNMLVEALLRSPRNGHGTPST